jgi:hypothetical protein
MIIGPTFMYKFNRTIILHGYRCFLEEKINSIVGKNVTVGAFLVKKKLLGNNPFTLLNYFLMSALVLVCIYFCHKYQPEFWNINFIIQASVAIIGMTFFMFDNSKSFNKGYYFGQNLYDADPKLIN